MSRLNRLVKAVLLMCFLSSTMGNGCIDADTPEVNREKKCKLINHLKHINNPGADGPDAGPHSGECSSEDIGEALQGMASLGAGETAIGVAGAVPAFVYFGVCKGGCMGSGKKLPPGSPRLSACPDCTADSKSSCPTCNGKGQIETPKVTCDTCGGEGTVPVPSPGK